MKILLLALLLTGAAACNSDNKTGERDYNMKENDEKINNIPSTENNLGDTTATTNSNVYNTDSTAGKASSYDTAAHKK